MPSLRLDEARTRRAVLGEVAYEVELDLSRDESFAAVTRARFTAEPGTDTFLDLQHARFVRVQLNGAELTDVYSDDKVHLPGLLAENEVVVEAEMPYVRDGDGMHHFVDPADGATYVGCYGGMDVNRRVLACFDQPDVKGTFAVTVTGRPGWTVVSNGRVLGQEGEAWTFAPTPPIASYLLSVCAGPFVSRRWEHAGLPFAWHARASLEEALDRDLEGLRQVTTGAYDWYAEHFTEPYPFDSYDQVFVPGHNWGAMECPGVVSFRDELLPEGTSPDTLVRRRAMTIAHEMAHMWFGDLVTFRWWEDTWLNESFADLMGFWVAGDVLGVNAFAEFEISRKAGGYAADSRPSTHPVAPTAEDVPDVDAAFNNFDPISYAKGNSCLRQLAFWLGEEDFLAGVNAHLSGARFGTATLDDFVAALSSATERDVAGWVEAWLRTSGHDTLVLERDPEGMTLRRVGTRPHRVRVTGYAVPEGQSPLSQVWEQEVVVGDEPVRLPLADVVLPNSTGETFARVAHDPAGRELLLGALSRVAEPHHRAVVWGGLLDDASRGELAPEVVLAAAEAHLPAEEEAIVVEHVLLRTLALLTRALPGDELPAALDRVAALALGVLDHPDLPTALRDAAVDAVLASSHQAGLLRSWLEGASGAPELSPAQRWDALVRLSRLGVVPEEELARHLAEDGSETGRLGALRAAAARPDAAAKDAALEQLLAPEASNREIGALAVGLFDPEQRELVDGLVLDYLRRAPEVGRRGQALAQVVGRATPTFRLTDQQLTALRGALEAGDLAPVLARSWTDLLHDQEVLGSA